MSDKINPEHYKSSKGLECIDCLEATVEGLVGVALLGTNITRGIIMTLSKYTVKTLVLDNDARAKAICLNKRHSCITRVRFTKKDLKHLAEGAIKCILE